ncbi:hypothetical protein [Bordetella tumulicola]|uniref:hypothetical protein n=1 Tax=Bordetella tumulicola TaxID=1649133 RepID=UPI0039EE6394
MRAEDILNDSQNHVERDGVVIRKGSVGAFLANATIWCDQTATSEQRQRAERDMRALLPGLRAIGLFDVFSIRDEALRTLIDTHYPTT